VIFGTGAIFSNVNGDQSGSFADWMKAARTATGINQLELSDRMGVDKSLVSRVESGQKEPTEGFAVALAHALEIDVREALLRAGYPIHDDILGVNNAQTALEITRLLYAINDDDERDAAISDIRALLSARRARLDARKAKRGADQPVDRGKAARHAATGG